MERPLPRGQRRNMLYRERKLNKLQKNPMQRSGLNKSEVYLPIQTNTSLSSLKPLHTTNQYSREEIDYTSPYPHDDNPKYGRTTSMSFTKKPSDSLPAFVPNAYDDSNIHSNIDDKDAWAQLKLFQKEYFEKETDSVHTSKSSHSNLNNDQVAVENKGINNMHLTSMTFDDSPSNIDNTKGHTTNGAVYRKRRRVGGISTTDIRNHKELVNCDYVQEMINSVPDSCKDSQIPKLSFPSPPMSNPPKSTSVSRTSSCYSGRKRIDATNERDVCKSTDSKPPFNANRDSTMYEKNKDRRRSKHSLHIKNRYHSGCIPQSKQFRSLREASYNPRLSSPDSLPILQQIYRCKHTQKTKDTNSVNTYLNPNDANAKKYDCRSSIDDERFSSICYIPPLSGHRTHSQPPRYAYTDSKI